MELDEQSIREEAEAFDKRITERVQSGFIPDLRRAVFCDHFYKSFWRDPHYIDLYLGWILRGLLDLLRTHAGQGCRILDVGCGAGYMSLELARDGYQVLAIDISEACIESARRTLETNPFTEGFGSLEYQVLPFELVEGQFDVVLFCVSMHHMRDVRGVAAKACALLNEGGHLLCYEPCHERFGRRDAAQVALIRGLMSLTGHWYQPAETADAMGDETGLSRYIDELRTEYVLERDQDEPGGQSPHDLEASGEEILQALRAHFVELEHRPGCSFIYRLLGGLRGPQPQLHDLADFLARYERLMVREGHLSPNMFFFMGRKAGAAG